MVKIVEAIYEDNVIKPLEKIRVKSKRLLVVIFEKKKKINEILKYMDKLENLKINEKKLEEKYYEKFSD